MNTLLAFQHFHFLRPYYLVILIALYFTLKLFAKRDDTLIVWRKLMSENILNNLTVAGNSQHFLSPQRLSRLLAIVVTLILMGPTWQQQSSPFSENNSALIIALDVSESMLQTDIQPTRLLRAKQKVNELLAFRGDTQTALLAFAGSAHTVMPITNDSDMIRHFLDVLDPSVMPLLGKKTSTILPIVNSLLSATSVPGTVLLITDGASDESIAAMAQYFNTHPNQLVIWPIGKSLSEVQSSNSEQGKSNISPMQLEQLEKLAQKSNGRLVNMTLDKTDISAVNQLIEHNLVVVDDESYPWLDAGYPLVFVAGFIFIFWFRKGWTLQW